MSTALAFLEATILAISSANQPPWTVPHEPTASTVILCKLSYEQANEGRNWFRSQAAHENVKLLRRRCACLRSGESVAFFSDRLSTMGHSHINTLGFTVVLHCFYCCDRPASSIPQSGKLRNQQARIEWSITDTALELQQLIYERFLVAMARRNQTSVHLRVRCHQRYGSFVRDLSE